MFESCSRKLLVGLPLAALITLSGCGSSPTSDAADTTKEHSVSTVTANEGVSSELTVTAAGEPFEALTEQAFSADGVKLFSLYDEAQVAADGIRDKLPPETAKALDARLAETKVAIVARQPADIALSAVEGYKLIASAFPADAKVPIAVSLLDYAGFRIQADLQSEPVRWADAAQAATYAQEQWSLAKDKVADTALRDKFEASVKSLQKATTIKDKAMATRAAKLELDLVDSLETYFQAM